MPRPVASVEDFRDRAADPARQILVWAWVSALHDAGVPVFPVTAATKEGRLDVKTPACGWKRYQTALPSRAQLEAWFRPGSGAYAGHGYAIVGGHRSGLVFLDCDAASASAWCDAHVPTSPVGHRSGRPSGEGEHRAYRFPPGMPDRSEAEPVPWLAPRTQLHERAPGEARRKLGLDLKASGSYVVGPGTLHASGLAYASTAGDGSPAAYVAALAELPTFDPAWLDDLCSCASAVCGGTRKRDDRPSPAGCSTVRVRLAPDERDEALYRASCYVDHVDGAAEGARDGAAFRLACDLVRGFVLPDEQAIALLAAWNLRCTPPLGEQQLRAKIRSAHRSGRRDYGYLLYQERRAEAPAALVGAADVTPAGEPASTVPEPAAKKIKPLDRGQRVRLRAAVARRQKPPGDPGRKRGYRVSECCHAWTEEGCDDHPEDGRRRRYLVCSNHRACVRCGEVYARQVGAHVPSWPDGRYHVLEVDVAALHPDELAADPVGVHQRVRREVRATIDTDPATGRRQGLGIAHRWFSGHARWLLVAPRGYGWALRRAERRGVRLRTVARADLAVLVHDVLAEPARVMQALRDAADWDAYAAHPYVTHPTHVPSYAGNRAGREALPIPTHDEVVAEIIARAHEERGEVDLDHCAHVIDPATGERCGQPLRRYGEIEGLGVLLEDRAPDLERWKFLRRLAEHAALNLDHLAEHYEAYEAELRTIPLRR